MESEEEEATLSNHPNDDKSKKSVEAFSILVVDADTTCLAIVAAILKKFKYEVVTVKHAKDALCTLRIKKGAFDLVVSDVHIPDMNGFELQQAIAQEFDNLPVVLMSADDEEGVALKGLETGAVFFIYKPVCPDDVQDLWQFAAKRRQSQVTIHEEKIKCNETAIISLSSSAVNEDRDSKKKSPSKEGSDKAKKGEACRPVASQKKTKIVWTNSLHNRFLEAIRSIGLDRAVPKKILEVMNVPGLTRENVASHLQKYRIFLRRVSDASYNIQNPPDHSRSSRHLFMTSSSTLESSSSSPPSQSPTTLMLNKFPYRKIGGQYFPASPNSLINQSGIFRQPRLTLPDKGSLATGLIKLNFHAQPPLINLEGLSTTTTTTTTTLLSPSTPLMGPTTLMNPANTSYYNDNNIATPSNYVGYSISNLKCLTGNSTAAVEPISVDDYTINNQLEAFDNSFGQLSNVVGDYGLSPDLSDMGNIHPMLDIYELEALLDPQPLQQGDHLDTSLGNQANILNQPQAQQNEGQSFTTTSNFYGNTSQWDHHFAPSFDPASNQQQYCNQDLVKPQEFLATSSGQLNNTILLPPNEQVREGLTNDFQGFDNSSKLLSKTPVPTVEPDDDEILESLLAPFGEIQSLEGI